jgi:anti-sigma factor RsiW
MEFVLATTSEVTPDVLRDYLEDRLSGFERQRIERVIRNDQEVARAFKMIREGTEVIRERLKLDEEVPPEWLAVISRWDLRGKT